VSYVHYVSDRGLRVAFGPFDMIVHEGRDVVLHLSNGEKACRELEATDWRGGRR